MGLWRTVGHDIVGSVQLWDVKMWLDGKLYARWRAWVSPWQRQRRLEMGIRKKRGQERVLLLDDQVRQLEVQTFGDIADSRYRAMLAGNKCTAVIEGEVETVSRRVR